MKYRPRSEIVTSILTSAKDIDGATKTKIMYHAFLSYGQLKEYVSFLVRNGLLEQTENNMYRTTAKGAKVLETYHKLNELVGIEHV